MRYNYLFKILSVAFLAFIISSLDIYAGLTISGKVVNQVGQPIIDASVIISRNGEYISGVSTDSSGQFIIELAGNSIEKSDIIVSSVKYNSDSLALIDNSKLSDINFYLSEKVTRIKSVSVISTMEHEVSGSSTISRANIEAGSRHSLIVTNPIAAIKQPQAIRLGSGHSSRIRASGSNPAYYINGIEIGQDPNHYGVFSIIPASVVKDVRFYPLGVGGQYSRPAVIEINSSGLFEKHRRITGNISSIEATGTFSTGNNNYFLLGSLRKSVLDKLVGQLNIESDKKSIPPTNFQDIFASAGWKISSGWRIMIDQYYVTDYLEYDAGETVGNQGGISTSQHTREHYCGLRLESISYKTYFKASAGYKSQSESYQAHANDNNNSPFFINLKSDSRTFLLNSEISFIDEKAGLTIGNSLKKISGRDIQLSQSSWNFLPPDAGSDNPYLYQEGLNRFYGSYSNSDQELDNSGYATFRYQIDNLKIESGIRAEYYGRLADKLHIVTRHSLKIDLGEGGNLELYYGTFAENPVSRILESYQVQVNDYLNQLQPITTNLISLSLDYKPLKISLYHKNISHLPILAPDFIGIDILENTNDCFLTMTSTGQAEFMGANISYRQNDFLREKLSVYSFYSYTYAQSSIDDVSFPYDLESPHRFYIQLDYKLNKTISFGGESTVRSGNPFTPVRRSDVYVSENRYSEDYYINDLSQTNSSRFPAFVTFNLFADFNFGNSVIFLSVANISNHDNPIINSSNGFIYDAGILPSIGYQLTF